ncbi:MAG: c-type cytochrome [Nitrosomonadales bacterium]|nr:c-type cytochrome [Nitrosomonadales bacterium]
MAALGGCSDSGRQANAEGKLPQIQAEPASGGTSASADLELGRKIYNFRCYYCHGYSGDARTLAASFLTPKPLDFTSASPQALPRERMLHSIQFGRPGTAMQSFSSVLQPRDIEAVADFIRQEFMVAKAENTRYHIAANGWFNHERYSAAYPFALGKIPLDTPWEQLTPEQAEGKRLFMTACVSCHDRARVNDEGVHWESRPVSYPRNQYNPGDQAQTKKPVDQKLDAMASASPYLLHDRAPKLKGLTGMERRGESLFQQNCAFCHAADGTGRNWIGSFLESHPRDLTNPEFMSGMTRTRLRTVIREGLVGTSMPAWKSVLSEQQIEDVIAYVGRAFHPLAAEQ